MAKMKRVVKDTRTPVAVVDAKGEEIEMRELRNTPLALLFPDVPVISVDWNALGGEVDHEQIKRDITYSGTTYAAWCTWGSSIKNGMTTGIPKKRMKEMTRLMRICEDAHRWNRAYLAEGYFGYGFGDINVYIGKCGQVFGGYIIHDGCGLIKQSVADEIATGSAKIHLNNAWDSWQFAQRIPWTEAVAQEVTAALKVLATTLSSPESFAYHATAYMKECRRWIDLEPELAKHQRHSNRLTKTVAKVLRTAASSIPTQSDYRIAIPAKEFTVEEESCVYCHPLDADACIQIVPGYTDAAEKKRVDECEAIQYTLTNDKASFKGILIPVPDEVIDAAAPGADMVVSDQDAKMYAWGWSRARKAGTLLKLKDAALCFTAWWDADSVFGAPPEIWVKLMGRDYDGDAGLYFHTRFFPEVCKEVAKLPPQTSAKLFKSKSPLKDKEDVCPRMAAESLKDTVGFASNVTGHTYMVADRTEIAELLGFQSVGLMDFANSDAVQIGTDKYRTYVLKRKGKNGKSKEIDISLEALHERLGQRQSLIRERYGAIAPWTKWKNSDTAFKHNIPAVLTPEQAEMWYHDERVLRKMLPEQLLDCHTGTVGQIAHIMLPNVKELLRMGEKFAVWPLSRFLQWGMSVPPSVEAEAAALQKWWIGRSARINWTDGDEVNGHYAEWDARVRDKAEEIGVSTWLMANAMWRVAHNGQSHEATGSSVFACLREDVERIVVEKPGLKEVYTEARVYKGIGLNHNVDGAPNTYTGVGTIEVMNTKKRGQTVMRAVLRSCPDLRYNKVEAPYPAETVMVFDLKKEQPPLGVHEVHWERQGNYNAWNVWLTAPSAPDAPAT